MNTQSPNNVNFYETPQDIGVMEPYAIMSAEELTKIIKRFVSWATMMATHPDLAESLGEEGTAHIRLATSFRAVVKESERAHTFPNIVLSTREFTAAMTLINVSQELEPGIHEMIIYESQKWEKDFQS
jgi:hypothetical protein